MSRFLGLDGIRAIACLLVVFHHAFQNLVLQKGGLMDFHQMFVNAASSGVSLFFVLSGMLLSQPFWQRYLDGRGMPAIKDYIIRRAARIMPGFYLVLTICFVVQMIIEPRTPFAVWRYITGLTFTSGFFYTTLFPTEVNGPLWSISFEVFSYLLLPIFMAGLFFTMKSRKFSYGILYWLGVLAFILALNDLIITYCQPDNIDRGWRYGLIGGAKYWMPNYNPVGFFAHYILGIFAAGLMTWFNHNETIKERLAKFYFFDIVACLGLAVFVAILWTQRKGLDFSFSFQHQPYHYPYIPLSIAIVLAVLPFSKYIGNMLDNRFFKYTAQISFGLYIWHHFILNVVVHSVFPSYRVFGMHNVWEWLGITAIALLISYIVATISWRLLEKPVLDAAHGISRKRGKDTTMIR